MQKVSYEISRHKESGEWVLWKSVINFQKENGKGRLKGIFSGTKKEGQEKLKEIKENDKRRRNKNVKKR